MISSRPISVSRVPEGHAGELLCRPADVDTHWLSLGQAWQPALSPNFRAGWARLRWHEDFLQYDMVYLGGKATNRAQTLNERTWDLGDVAEIFLQRVGLTEYLEVHITPENRRLQLLFPEGAITRVRAKQAALETFFVAQPDWVQSRTMVAADHWSVRVTLPPALLHLDAFGPGQRFMSAVCRYDAQPEGPVLSATTPFTELSFHQREAWQELQLAPHSP
ncbi:MAG: hypothetical protein V4773_26275 [Verrucomicrobiota bacterium]